LHWLNFAFPPEGNKVAVSILLAKREREREREREIGDETFK